MRWSLEDPPTGPLFSQLQTLTAPTVHPSVCPQLLSMLESEGQGRPQVGKGAGGGGGGGVGDDRVHFFLVLNPASATESSHGDYRTSVTFLPPLPSASG